ncbi:hypothetical protein PAXRUDRAFT_826196 [Paxillus rubicundulus Ve08.2h10]|uniref:Uncharacterized protein n=1 Tax=Paxillus rubicundulus Ve08.2h10 TaxID=930991 RepID=A0A0D0DS80_9AGAM|nr:hypothetical protein PAXRUDRAFT_826196 [Paxillus rubicundulus Ve08.2h10]
MTLWALGTNVVRNSFEKIHKHHGHRLLTVIPPEDIDVDKGSAFFSGCHEFRAHQRGESAHPINEWFCPLMRWQALCCI